MKMLVFVMAVTVLSMALLLAVWRARPRIPGLPHSPETLHLEEGWRLWLCFLLGGLVLSSASALAVGQAWESTMGYLRIVLSTYAGEDSWMPMLRASEHLRNHPGVPVYEAVFFGAHVKFQYPLTALLPMDLPQQLLGMRAEDVIAAFKLLSRLCVPLIALAFYKLFMGSMQETSGGRGFRMPPNSRATLLGLSMLSVLLFYPLIRSEYHGQIQTAMTLAAALALLAWQRGRPRLAGVLIALCCVIKPQWALIILWALLRRQWNFALAAMSTAGAFLLVALSMYGIDNVLGYLPVVSFLGRHGESYFINQSVNGLVHRMLFNGANLQGAGLVWSGTDFPPYNAVVYAATTISSALILVMAMVWKAARRPGSLDLAIMMLSLTIASPIAWDHHYGILLPILAILFPAALRSRPWGKWTVPYLWVAVTLTGQTFVAVTNLFAESRLNILQSYLFAGALMIIGLAYRLSWQEQTVGAQAPLQDSRLAGLT